MVFDSIGSTIVDIINLSLLTGSVPSHFKHAIVQPLLKKTNLDPALPSNYRPISKLPFVSKLLEKVVAEQLTAVLESHCLYDAFQSGFRKIHSTETALLKVTNDIMMAADGGKCSALVLLDLSSAFDTVDHGILLNRLNQLVGISGSALDWFSSYLTDRTFSVATGQFISHTVPLSCGVPQGSVLGPMLFSLYMLPLGQIISQYSGISYHFYADDIQLYCSFKADESSQLLILNDCLDAIKSWMSDNYLQLNLKKTESLIVAPEHSIPAIKQSLGPLSAHAQSTVRNLGVIFDQSLSLDSHVRQLIGSCYYQLRNIAKLRSVVTRIEMEMIIHAFISSRLDYCNALFTCLNQTTLNRLQTIQNAAARLLTSSNRRCHITPILSSLHWLPIKFRIDFKILVLTFRALHGQTPQYIADLLLPYSPNLPLRSSNQILLCIPRTHFKTRGDRAFQAVAPKLWNALPYSLRSIDSCSIFMKQVKTFLFRQAFG